MSNTKEDIKRLQERAEAGDASAQNSLGCAYHNADGVARDYTKAREWYLRAAAQKESYAQNNLGQLYLYGNGVTANTGQALRWFKKSALNGNQYGLLHLAEMYEKGKGVEKDIMTAYKLYEKAANKGNKQAKNKIDILKKVYDKDVDMRIITCPLVSENIFRVLGIYANSSSREITAHKAKIHTFLSVGKDVTFETDHLVRSLYPNIYPHNVSIFEDMDWTVSQKQYSSMSLLSIYKTIGEKKLQLHALSQSEIYYSYIRSEIVSEESLSPKDRGTLTSIKDLEKQLSDLQKVYDQMRKKLIIPKREKDGVDFACNAIEDNTQRLKYSFFWFFNTDETDVKAFGHINSQNVEAAYSEWDESGGFNSLMNVAVLSFLRDDNETYIECVTNVIHTEEYRTDFIKAVCGNNYQISEQNLAHLFIDTLLSYLPNENWQAIFKKSGVSSDDDEYIESKLICIPTNDLDKEIKKAKSERPVEAAAHYNNILQFKDAIFNCLDDFTDIIRNKGDYRYGMMCDKASDAMISLSQSYYHACSEKEYDCTSQCVELASYALSIASGASAKSRAENAYEEIKAIHDKMPSKDVYGLILKIRSYIGSQKSFSNVQRIPNANKVVEQCAPMIVELQEKTSKADKSYIKISTEVVEYALAIIIDVFNHDFEEFDKLVERKKDQFVSVGNVRYYDTEVSNKIKSIKDMLKNCCALISNLDLFDKEVEYAKQRYDKNRNAILRQAREFGIATGSYLPSIDMRNDDEFFNDCTTRVDYESYIKHHSHGKHVTEANSRIEQIKKEEAVEDDFGATCKEHQTFKVYLQHYPQGRYVKQAKETKDKLTDSISNRISVCIIFIILSLFFLSFIIFYDNNSQAPTSSENKTESIQNQHKETEEDVSSSDESYSSVETEKSENYDYNEVNYTDDEETEDATRDDYEDVDYNKDESNEDEY